MFISYEGNLNNYSNRLYKKNQKKLNIKSGGSASLVDRIISNINLFSLDKVDVKCYSDDLNTILNDIIRKLELIFADYADSSETIDTQNFKSAFNRTLQTVLNAECFKDQTADKLGIRRMANMYCKYPVKNNVIDSYYLPGNIKKISSHLGEFRQLEKWAFYFEIGIAAMVFFISIKLFLISK